jgi:hypothetical protein
MALSRCSGYLGYTEAGQMCFEQQKKRVKTPEIPSAVILGLRRPELHLQRVNELPHS